MGETPSEASSWIEAVQQALGVTWAQMMTWLGPGVMTLWCWTGQRDPGQFTMLPREAPLRWAQRMVDAAGVDTSWPLVTSQWLHARDGLYWTWLFAAALLACHSVAARHQGALISLSTFCLLAAMELGNPEATWVGFLLSTLLVCVGAILLDFQSEKSFQSAYICIPEISITRWITGPTAVAFGMLYIPLIVVAGAFAAFRVEAAPMPPVQPTGAIPLYRGSPLTRENSQQFFHPSRARKLR